MLRELKRLALAVAVFTPVGAEAQVQLVSQALDSNTVIRVRLRTGLREKARLLADFGPDSTLLRYCRDPSTPCVRRSIRYIERPATDAVALEVRRGSRALTGAVIGAPIGLAIGWFAVALSENASELPGSTGKRAGIMLPVTALFAGIGALMGAGIDVWSPAR
jgi:hypothetical protein